MLILTRLMKSSPLLDRLPWAEAPCGNDYARGCYFSGGGGGGEQTSSTTTQRELSPEQRELVSLALPAARDFAANPPKDYPGAKIAPLTDAELQAQQMTLGAAAGPAMDIARSAASGNQFLTSGAVLYPESNPALGASISGAIRPVARSFTDAVLPNIRSQSIQAGQVGGTRRGIAEGIAASRFGESAFDTASKMASDAYKTGLDNFTKGQLIAPQVQQAQYSPGITVGAVGGQQRAQEQALINEKIQRDMYEKMAPFMAAQQVAQMAMGLGGGPTTSTSTGPAPYQPDNTMQNLASLASIAAIAMMMM